MIGSMSNHSTQRDWGRLITAMLTPFAEDGSVAYAEAARLAKWLVEVQRNDGLVVSGTTGESPTLEEDEKLRLLDTVLEAVGDTASVIFGAGTYNTAESIRLAKAAERAGAHGAMLVNPYYSRPGQEGLYAHFAAVAESVSLRVMLYNIQGRSAINLETPTLMRLTEVANIVAVKEASGNIGQIGDVCASVPDGFRVYCGDDALTLPALALGAHGVVSVAGHVLGRQIKEMIERFPSDWPEALRLHREMLRPTRALFQYPNPVPVKFALSLRGFACESVRLPLVVLDEHQKQDIRRALPIL